MPRIRIRMQKLGRCAYLSHLDVVRSLERAIRRSGLSLAFSEGFHPHPKISFAAPLPVGVTSEAEVTDIEFVGEVRPDEVRERLALHLPGGLGVDRAVEVPSGEKSLMSQVAAARYSICIPASQLKPGSLSEEISRLMARDSLEIARERKGSMEAMDVRPLIFEIRVACSDRCASEIEACVATGSEDNLRPVDLVSVMSEYGIVEPQPMGIEMHRLEILIRRSGSLVPPI